MNPRAIEALWYEPGTPADAANAAHHASGRRKHFTADMVRDIWAKAQREGRLPPFERPANGFPPAAAVILKRFMMIEQQKRAA